jgi:hypothetical protein
VESKGRVRGNRADHEESLSAQLRSSGDDGGETRRAKGRKHVDVAVNKQPFFPSSADDASSLIPLSTYSQGRSEREQKDLENLYTSTSSQPQTAAHSFLFPCSLFPFCLCPSSSCLCLAIVSHRLFMLLTPAKRCSSSSSSAVFGC